MPELITHSVFAYLFRPYMKTYWVFLLIGAVLPDVLSRLPMLFLSRCSECSYLFLPSHSPFFLIFVSLLIAFFFQYRHRWPIFIGIYFGALSHFFLDFLQKHVGQNGYPWFFPVNFKSIELGLFWSDTSVYLIPVSLFILALVLLFQYREKLATRFLHKKKVSKNKPSRPRRIV